ncbi:MAG: hypothetical protein QM729_03235 [Solirubrobacterales bacterium]
MGTRTLPIRLLAVLAMSVCALPLSGGSASAAHEKIVHHRASFSFEADLPSTHGYALILRASDHRDIELAVEREPSAEPYVTMFYRVRGHVGRHGIHADLGRFGRVDLRFAGHLHEGHFHYPNCSSGAQVTTRSGVLEGLVEFEALERRIELTAHRVEGGTREEPARTCTPKPSQVSEGGDESSYLRRPAVTEGKGEGFVADFSALAHTGGRTIEIYAVRLNDEIGPGIVPDMAATSTRRFGRVLVSTSVHAPESEEEVPGEGALFSIPGKGTRPHRATLSAPEPFSGSGTYTYRPGSPPTFLGSLEVAVPGEGTLPLAGPEFHAALCNFAEVRRQRACEETVGPAHTV